MQNKIKILAKILGKILLFLTFIVIKILTVIFSGFEKALRYFCLKLCVETTTPEINLFQPTFSDGELETMAGQSDKSMTLKEIQEKFNISYRQARKIKEMIDNSLDIHRYNPMDIRKVYT